MTWPYAHVPHGPWSDQPCGECGKVRWVILVMDYGTERKPELPGAIYLCWPCLGRDGDPLHRLR